MWFEGINTKQHLKPKNFPAIDDYSQIIMQL